MNSQKIIKGKLFLAVLVTMLCGMVAGGCSDDKDELEGKQYGYVQFKLYKKRKPGRMRYLPAPPGWTS
mgnify:CR=1 FL=1